jgi:hypothetical protein
MPPIPRKYIASTEASKLLSARPKWVLGVDIASTFLFFMRCVKKYGSLEEK